jgi:hypothetical protein
VGDMWSHETASGQRTDGAAWALTSDAPLHGRLAQRMSTSAHAGVGVANRGYNSEGLSFTDGIGKPWEGYFFARGPKPVVLRVALEDYFTTPRAATTAELVLRTCR